MNIVHEFEANGAKYRVELTDNGLDLYQFTDNDYGRGKHAWYFIDGIGKYTFAWDMLRGMINDVPDKLKEILNEDD